MRWSAILLILLWASNASAQNTLQWDEADPTAVSYEFLIGSTSGNYSTAIPVTTNTYKFPNGVPTTPTYVAVRALNAAGDRSLPSAELVVVPAPAPVPDPAPVPPPPPAPVGCPDGKTLQPKGTLWTFTIKTNTKASYTNYVLSLGGWTLLQSKSSSGGNWLLQFRCDR